MRVAVATLVLGLSLVSSANAQGECPLPTRSVLPTQPQYLMNELSGALFGTIPLDLKEGFLVSQSGTAGVWLLDPSWNGGPSADFRPLLGTAENAEQMPGTERFADLELPIHRRVLIGSVKSVVDDQLVYMWGVFSQVLPSSSAGVDGVLMPLGYSKDLEEVRSAAEKLSVDISDLLELRPDACRACITQFDNCIRSSAAYLGTCIQHCGPSPFCDMLCSIVFEVRALQCYSQAILCYNMCEY